MALAGKLVAIGPLALSLPIYFINLNARTDRRRLMEAQFARLTIQAERIEAVETSAAARRLPEGWLCTTAEFACTLSHVKSWRALLASDAPAAVVLEDDAILSDSFAAVLDPAPYERFLAPPILKLETRRVRAVTGRSRYRLGGYEVRRLMSVHMGTCGYIISRSAAADFLQTIEQYPLPVDVFVFGEGNGQLFRRDICQLVPGACIPAEHLHEDPSLVAIAASDLKPGRKFHIMPAETAWQEVKRRLLRRLMQFRVAASDPIAFVRRGVVDFSRE